MGSLLNGRHMPWNKSENGGMVVCNNVPIKKIKNQKTNKWTKRPQGHELGPRTTLGRFLSAPVRFSVNGRWFTWFLWSNSYCVYEDNDHWGQQNVGIRKHLVGEESDKGTSLATPRRQLCKCTYMVRTVTGNKLTFIKKRKLTRLAEL